MDRQAVLITGGTSGIGRATAELLHERGLPVMVTGSTDQSVAAARAKLPGEIRVVRANSASFTDTARLIAEARDAFGTLTGVFLNSGTFTSSAVENIDEALWDRLFDVFFNAKGQFFTMQKALPLLVDGASIVFTVGIGATRGSVGASVAAGSRGALLTMIPSLAVELAPRGIRVNAVSPGPINTPLLDKLGMPVDQVATIKDALAGGVPLQRTGTSARSRPPSRSSSPARLLTSPARTSSSAAGRAFESDAHRTPHAESALHESLQRGVRAAFGAALIGPGLLGVTQLARSTFMDNEDYP